MSTDTTHIPSQGGDRIPEDTLAARVRSVRWETGLSQRAAAEACGLTFGEWQSLEDGRGARQLDIKVDRIAKGLGYDRNWLMWGRGDRTSRVFRFPFVPIHNEDETDTQYATLPLAMAR